MKATQLKSKLESQLSCRLEALGRLRAERASLALAAHSGDEAAMLRLQDLRADITTGEGEIKDLEQALADLQGALAVESASDVLQHRRAMEGAYRDAARAVIAAAKPVDAAIEQLAEVRGALHEAVQTLHFATIDLLVAPARDVGEAAMRRFEASMTTGAESIHERINHAIRNCGVGRQEMSPLVGLVEGVISSLDARVRNVIRADEATARAAGVTVGSEPEVEAA